MRQNSFNELEQATAQIEQYVTYYHTQRLHSALGYVAPLAKLQGHEARRQQQLRQARQLRRQILGECPDIIGG